MVLDGTVDKVVEMDCMDTDIVIVGGGLTGLCMARALHGTGLQIRIVEMAESKMLAEPADDGREIALTHPSRAQLESLGFGRASTRTRSASCETPGCLTASRACRASSAGLVRARWRSGLVSCV